VRVETTYRTADYENHDMYDTVHLKPAPGIEYGNRFLTRLKQLQGR
jgi:hypothetical protein